MRKKLGSDTRQRVVAEFQSGNQSKTEVGRRSRQVRRQWEAEDDKSGFRAETRLALSGEQMGVNSCKGVKSSVVSSGLSRVVY